MEITEAGLLLAAGLAAGAVNAVAGGGSLVTYPALVAIGLPPVAANVTNSIAVSPGYLASVAGSRADLAGQRGRLLLLLPTAAVGSAAGCALLLVTPERAFELVVPFLVLGASAALAVRERLQRLTGTSTGTTGTSTSTGTGTGKLQLIVGLSALYGGYFGAALGVMLVAGLAVVLGETLARVNAAKNAISAVVGLVTVAAYAAFGPVNWAAVGVVAPAALIGGYAGARLAPRLPPRLWRAGIVAFGTAIGLLLLVRALTG